VVNPAASTQAAEAGFDQQFLKQLEYLHVVAKKVFAGKSRAERRSRGQGSGIEFADHRDYTAGDDLRYLDWSVYGRMDRLLLRLFEQEEDLHIYLLIDRSASMRLGGRPELPLLRRSSEGRIAKLGYAAQVTAARAYVGLANLDRVAIYGLGERLSAELPASRGKGQIFKVFDFLAGLTPEGKTDLRSSIGEFVQRIKRRGIAIVVSDFYDHSGYEEGLNLLRYHRFEPAAIQIIDPVELNPPLRGDLEIVDMETGELREVTLSQSLIEAYQREHHAYCEALAAFCKSRSISYIRAETAVPFDELTLRALRQGGFIR
jgi:uncharacterized protein (DUF58 family)